MRSNDNTVRAMPDIANEARPAVAGALDWVGMGEIEAPVQLAIEGQAKVGVARVNAFVNLVRPDVRGIHMSRLYLHVDRMLSAEPLSSCSVRRILKEFLESHAELSDRAMLRVRFELMLRRPALVSDNSGWRAYPVELVGVMDRGHYSLELATEVVYSSTCPCSAALARQLIQERFSQDFDLQKPIDSAAMLAWLGSEQGICATPHSQRSTAEVKVKLLPSFQGFPIVDLIDRLEACLQTPVQTAVKREDEQAFARLNGQNLMFCEDAARRMQSALNQDERIADFWLRATHYESLHPHNAVAVASKGVDGGYSALS
ncbi:GTP cyclohydrolase FolE2 [Pseudomarimonas arenosa]|uniref:GTP cyclohydrolase FolE2 n=1 Tax=Pseudomarimonas arenosa TaxID=2774145 RepID=A0AAW3ZJ96_9GAMM|nr:GTP cyclohydrolase FolE2 [Pseudomarimonas arenosa]MBD8524789.1 GTP cyclohydrolase I FolE2 [Pseudomarimonas arenosa]